MIKKTRVLITCAGKLPEWCLKFLREKFDLLEVGCAISEDSLAENLKSAEGLITGGNEKLTKKSFAQCPGLKWEIFLGKQASTSHDSEVWKSIKDRVFTTGGGEQAVANEALRYINIFNPLRLVALEASGLLPTVSVSEKYPGLIIGPGTIGRKVLAGCTDADYCGRRPKEGLENRQFFSLNNLQEAIAGRRFVSIHLELTPETTGILRAAHFQYASPDLFFANFARAGIMEPEEFYKLLEMFPFMWAVWDVFYKEGADHSKLLSEKSQNTHDFLLKRILNMYPCFWDMRHTAADSPETFEEYGQGVVRIIEEQKI